MINYGYAIGDRILVTLDTHSIPDNSPGIIVELAADHSLPYAVFFDDPETQLGTLPWWISESEIVGRIVSEEGE